MIDLRSEDLIRAQATTLRPSFRWYVAVLAALICAVLCFVAVTAHAPRAIFFYLFAVVIAVVLALVYRREATLVQNFLVVSGTVTALNKTRRGYAIRYEFRALDGKGYEGEADLSPVHKTLEGERTAVLYNPLDPILNLPVNGFMFYSFTSWEREAEGLGRKNS